MRRAWDLIGFFLVVILPVGANGQGLPERQAVEAFRIGGKDVPDYAAFVLQPAIAGAPDGTIFVRSPQPPVIDVFDAEGHHLRTIGREGEGPGEFRVLAGHGLLGDTLWVLDVALLRMSTFLHDGTHVRTWRLEPIDLGIPLSARHTITALLAGPYALAVPMANPVGAGGRVPLPVLLGDRDFQESHPVLEVVRPRGMRIRGVGSFSFQPFLLPPLVSVATNGRGFLTADWTDEREGSLVVTLYAPSGEVDWVQRINHSATPVLTVVRDSLLAHGQTMAGPYVERARNKGTIGRESIRDLVSEGLYIPTYYPPASQILLGPDGSVWIRSGEFAELVEWTVLDAQGEAKFTVHLPETLWVKEVTFECVWGTTVDDLDIPYVVRYDIR